LLCPGGPLNTCSSHGACIAVGGNAKCECADSNQSIYSSYIAPDCSIPVHLYSAISIVIFFE
jgi:hypothetical protein